MNPWAPLLYKLPKDVELSQDLRERSIAYMEMQSLGRRFYVPITKDLKKLLKLHIVNGELILSYEQARLLEDVFRDILRGAELQLRDEVAGQIESTLLGEVRDGFAKLFAKPIRRMVKQKLDQKLLEGKIDSTGGNDAGTSKRS